MNTQLLANHHQEILEKAIQLCAQYKQASIVLNGIPRYARQDWRAARRIERIAWKACHTVIQRHQQQIDSMKVEVGDYWIMNYTFMRRVTDVKRKLIRGDNCWSVRIVLEDAECLDGRVVNRYQGDSVLVLSPRDHSKPAPPATRQPEESSPARFGVSMQPPDPFEDVDIGPPSPGYDVAVSDPFEDPHAAPPAPETFP